MRRVRAGWYSEKVAWSFGGSELAIDVSKDNDDWIVTYRTSVALYDGVWGATRTLLATFSKAADAKVYAKQLVEALRNQGDQPLIDPKVVEDYDGWYAFTFDPNSNNEKWKFLKGWAGRGHGRRGGGGLTNPPISC